MPTLNVPRLMHQTTAVVQHSDERRSFVTREIAGETLIVPVTGHVMDLESHLRAQPGRLADLGAARARRPPPDRIADAVAGEFDVSRAATPPATSPSFSMSLSTRGLIQAADEGHLAPMDTLSYGAFSEAFQSRLAGAARCR